MANTTTQIELWGHQPILALMFMPFYVLALKDYYIIRLSNSLALSIPDEGYSQRLSCPLNLIFTFLSLSLCRCLCWWTISPQGHHQPSNQSFGTDMDYVYHQPSNQSFGTDMDYVYHQPSNQSFGTDMDYLYHKPSSQCFGKDMDYLIYLLSKFTLHKSCIYYYN